MSGLGRLQRFSCCPANGGYRRVPPVAPRPREGPLTEPTAGAQPWPFAEPVATGSVGWQAVVRSDTAGRRGCAVSGRSARREPAARFDLSGRLARTPAVPRDAQPPNSGPSDPEARTRDGEKGRWCLEGESD